MHAGWPAIFRYLPDALIFGGDNVYGDIDNESYGPPTPQLKELAASYKNQSRNADFNKARYTVPYVYATWVRPIVKSCTISVAAVLSLRCVGALSFIMTFCTNVDMPLCLNALQCNKSSCETPCTRLLSAHLQGHAF